MEMLFSPRLDILEIFAYDDVAFGRRIFDKTSL